MDRIVIEGLRVLARVGAGPHEHAAPQPLRIDLALQCDLRGCAALADTADYRELAARVTALAGAAHAPLLESLAQRIADTALALPRVEAVEVRVCRPRPPLPEEVDHVAVELRRSRTDHALPEHPAARAIVGLGSNLGDRAAHLRAALAALGPIVAQSQLFETDPVGGPAGQGRYLNMVAVAKTRLDPFAFHRLCLRTEAEAGRERLVPSGPRTLDIDLLFYDDVRIDSPTLTVPHPRYAARRFVLAPLSEVAPERCPPGWQDALPPAGVHARGPLPPPETQTQPGPEALELHK